MSRLRTGFRFSYASYLLVKDDPLFHKYLIRFGVGGLIILLVWFIPLALVVSLIGLTSVGLILIGLVMLFALFSLFIWGRVTAIQVISVFDGYIHPDKNSEDETSKQTCIGPHTREAALLAFLVPGLHFDNVLKGLFKSPNQEGRQWVEAGYLIWPVIAVESLSLHQAVDRLKQIKRENLIRFHPGFIPVARLTGMINWIFIILGAWIGFVVGMNTADPLSSTPIVSVLGALIGLLLAGFFVMMGIHINTFSQACYYSALYRWVKNVETAMITGMPEKAAPPAILGQSLRKTLKNKKER